VFSVSVIVKVLSHTAVFTSNVQCVRLAVGRVDDALKPAKSSCFQLLLLRHLTFHEVV